MKTLLIVESPAKSKTIEKLLGPGYIVLASFGHIRNLDKKDLGIDVNNGFKPSYTTLPDKSKQIKAIQEAIKKVDNVLLAADEDREGEAIAWHCAVVFKLKIDALNRICFHEITKSALEHAVANPRTINMSMVYSQQARRILDRLVGFKLSPLLWKHIAPKLSAGRVQSSALKLLVDQEKEVAKFTEKKYYKTLGLFNKKINATLNHNFEKSEDVLMFLNDCKKSIFTIIGIDKKNVEKKPPPPYITSTIQQDIGSRFSIGSKKIMSILQKLYESGYITYHRTDSTNLSNDVQGLIKTYICDKFGKNYLHARIYKSKIKCAQEAHEAIRPTKINLDILGDDTFDELEKKIYNIIWKRTVASQMSACITELYTITINISNRKELFIARAEKMIFDGYKKIYDDVKNDDNADDCDAILPNDFVVDNIKNNEILQYLKITSTEKYQSPPPRYNESTLIKKMEKIGIGRPSTYSNIIETIIERKYSEKKDLKGLKVDIDIYILEKNDIKNKKESIVTGSEKKKLVPTDLGINKTAFLENNFSQILDYNFTSNLEEKLDEIANSNMQWDSVVKDFYEQFIPNVDKLNDKALISKSKDERKKCLGTTDDGKSVYVYVAKYGPVIQIGDDKDIKYVKLDSEYGINSVTLDDIKEIIKYPKKIGVYKEKDILLKNGMYGYYIYYNEQNYKLLESMDENININDAIKCIDTKDGQNTDTIKIDKYTIKNGPYGYYILFNKKFYSIPKEYDVTTLTKELCATIIKIPKKIYKKKET
jgi:DNA topoisomerase-1